MVLTKNLERTISKKKNLVDALGWELVRGEKQSTNLRHTKTVKNLGMTYAGKPV